MGNRACPKCSGAPGGGRTHAYTHTCLHVGHTQGTQVPCTCTHTRRPILWKLQLTSKTDEAWGLDQAKVSDFGEKKKELRSERTKCQERKGRGSRDREPWQSLKSAPAEDIDWRVEMSHLGSCWTKLMAKSPKGSNSHKTHSFMRASMPPS